MTILFGGKPEEKLDSTRLSIFYQKVAGSVKFVKPGYLPPICATTKDHSFRTIHQFKYGNVEQIWPPKIGIGL